MTRHERYNESSSLPSPSLGKRSDKQNKTTQKNTQLNKPKQLNTINTS